MRNLRTPFLSLLTGVLFVGWSANAQVSAPATDQPQPPVAPAKTEVPAVEPPAQDPVAAFQAAVTALEQGKAGQARDMFLKLVDSTKTAPLFYNLANAEHALKHGGQAVLWYRRALLLQPNFAEAKHNLELVTGELASITPEAASWKPMVAMLSRTQWLLGGSVLFWSGVFLLFFAFRAPKDGARRALFFTVAGVSLAVAVWAGVCWWLKRDGSGEAGDFVVIRDKAVPVRASATATSSEIVADVTPGSIVRAGELRGSWVHAKLSKDKSGWIRRDDVEPLWPWDPNLLP